MAQTATNVLFYTPLHFTHFFSIHTDQPKLGRQYKYPHICRVIA